MVSKAQIKQVRSLQQKKFRDELGLFVAEGDKCVEELQKAFELVSLYREGENADRTSIEQMSGLRTPQGTIGIFRKRPEDTFLPSTDELVLALDGIQDPGNLGTIIRTCDWFGVHDILCSRDTWIWSKRFQHSDFSIQIFGSMVRCWKAKISMRPSQANPFFPPLKGD